MTDRSHKVAEVLALPGLPKGADRAMKLKRDRAIAAFCLHKGVMLEEAARAVSEIMDQVSAALEQALAKSVADTSVGPR